MGRIDDRIESAAGPRPGRGDVGERDTARADVPPASFEAFVAASEPRLRVALVATFGPIDGRSAACDALSWAWEHWDQVQAMTNPVGYLFRVGQSAARRHRPRPIPMSLQVFREHAIPEIDPRLGPALGVLSAQQRTTVLLVHAFGWTIREVAQLLDVAPSTVQVHLARGLDRLRSQLGGSNDAD